MATEPTPRRSWFAIWRWPRWTWCIASLLFLVTYFLSAIPVSRMAWLCESSEIPWHVARKLYSPVWWCASQSKTIRAVIEFENRQFNRVSGKGRVTIHKLTPSLVFYPLPQHDIPYFTIDGE